MVQPWYSQGFWGLEFGEVPKADERCHGRFHLVSSRNHLNLLARDGKVKWHLFLRDEVVPVLALLQATESHLCAGNVFLGVFKILKLQKSAAIRVWEVNSNPDQRIFLPCDSLLLVGIGV